MMPQPTQPQGFGSYEAYAEYAEPVTTPGYSDSLWSRFVGVAEDVTKWGVGLYEKIAKPSAPDALVFREPQRGTPESPNYQIYTPYPRVDNTNKPASTAISPAFGFSSKTILILAGLALAFYMMKGKKS